MAATKKPTTTQKTTAVGKANSTAVTVKPKAEVPAVKPATEAPAVRKTPVKKAPAVKKETAPKAEPKVETPAAKVEPTPAPKVETPAPKAAKPAEKKAAAPTEAKKHILFVCSEAAPFCGTGGLAEVMGSLPKSINDSGDKYEARIICPLYESFPYEERKNLEFICHINVPLAWRNQYCGLFKYDYQGVTY